MGRTCRDASGDVQPGSSDSGQNGSSNSSAGDGGGGSSAVSQVDGALLAQYIAAHHRIQREGQVRTGRQAT